MHTKLPGQRHSRSNLFTKVGDMASTIGKVHGVYTAGRTLYQIGQAAYPYLVTGAAVL